jgi:hypothetical protein
MRTESTYEVIRRLILARAVISTREVAAEANVSRQAAQKLLHSLVNDGELAIEGKARAARYRRVDDSGVVDSPAVDDGPGIDDPVGDSGFRSAAQLSDWGTPYAALPYAGLQEEAQRIRLDVASAGSLYRLSARILLCDLEADEAELDFTGVMDVGDEFLEEIFQVWSKAHPSVQLIPVNVPQELAARIDAVIP